MKADKDDPGESISTEDRLKYNKFYKSYCTVAREDVFHGVTIEGNGGENVCLYCRQKYDLNVINNLREIVERSLGESYEEDKDKVDLSPPPKKRPKKRWYHKYLFWRG